MGKPITKVDYEDIRTARILENQARLASLGIINTVSDLRQVTCSAKSKKPLLRKWEKKVYAGLPLRRSQRLKTPETGTGPGISLELKTKLVPRRSHRLKAKSADSAFKGVRKEIDNERDQQSFSSERVKRPANAPFIQFKELEHRLSLEASARRCNSKGRGSVYDPIFGICCHFCRQKKLCGEEDCKRCGDLDVDEPCLGKTDCSVCHSSTGVFCRACLKVRYGEGKKKVQVQLSLKLQLKKQFKLCNYEGIRHVFAEIEEVKENKEWMCPHCIEEKGTRPFWICNSSICLKKRHIPPTGLAIYRARELGYESVAHLLMDELKRSRKLRG